VATCLDITSFKQRPFLPFSDSFYAADVVPHGHAERHPLGHLPSFARVGGPLGIRLLDLFLATFLVHRADPPPGFGPEQLYGSPGQLRALQDVLHSLGDRAAAPR
jgi:hypothetical protein